MIEETELLSKDKNINFKNNLDNIKAIHFNNGLYKIETKKIVKHKQEHFLTMTTGYKFTREYSKNKDDLINYLENILPNEDMRNYFLIHLAKCLCCDSNDNNTITYLIGDTKKIIELIKLTFGDYYTNETNIQKKRICITNNYENSTTSLFITINTLNCKNINPNSKNRYISFLNMLDLEKDNDNLELWKQDFMLLLLDKYEENLEKNDEKYAIPKIILQIPIFNANTEIVFNFLKENTTKMQNNNIFSTTLYDHFKYWFNINYDSKIMGSRAFLSEVRNYYKLIDSVKIDDKVSTGFKNIKMKIK